MNCWEFRQCGCEEGGANAEELGVCPAYPDHGHACAFVRGTLCRGKAQGHPVAKVAGCLQCEFHRSPHFDRSARPRLLSR